MRWWKRLEVLSLALFATGVIPLTMFLTGCGAGKPGSSPPPKIEGGGPASAPPKAQISDAITPQSKENVRRSERD